MWRILLYCLEVISVIVHWELVELSPTDDARVMDLRDRLQIGFAFLIDGIRSPLVIAVLCSICFPIHELACLISCWLDHTDRGNFLHDTFLRGDISSLNYSMCAELNQIACSDRLSAHTHIFPLNKSVYQILLGAHHPLRKKRNERRFRPHPSFHPSPAETFGDPGQMPRGVTMRRILRSKHCLGKRQTAFDQPGSREHTCFSSGQHEIWWRDQIAERILGLLDVGCKLKHCLDYYSFCLVTYDCK